MYSYYQSSFCWNASLHYSPNIRKCRVINTCIFMLTRKPLTIFKRWQNNQVSEVEKNHHWRSKGILHFDSLSITWNQNMDNKFINDEDLKRKSAAPSDRTDHLKNIALIIFIAVVIAETAVICVLLASVSRSTSYVKDRSFDALLEQNNVSFLDWI